jgi:hypothetical protein
VFDIAPRRFGVEEQDWRMARIDAASRWGFSSLNEYPRDHRLISS